MPPQLLISASDAKQHLRVYHQQDDVYIESLIDAVCLEWEEVTHQYIGQGFINANPAQRYLQAPDDGVFRPFFNPVETGMNPVIICDATPFSPITPTEDWLELDRASAYPIGDSLISNANYTYPLYFTYNLATAFDAQIKQALLMRIGYFYSYRGDDPSPPDMKGWLMLVARHRTGAII